MVNEEDVPATPTPTATPAVDPVQTYLAGKSNISGVVRSYDEGEDEIAFETKRPGKLVWRVSNDGQRLTAMRVVLDEPATGNQFSNAKVSSFLVTSSSGAGGIKSPSGWSAINTDYTRQGVRVSNIDGATGVTPGKQYVVPVNVNFTGGQAGIPGSLNITDPVIIYAISPR